ncbi:hypothetical protein AURDEDRAFT_178269 [Auricularia subglabra TFB-10046 SS5]|uniref:Retrotransposon gag domain-containing protein n=1 Tax=Auricularia subglabra (strain TFB-10046 / SS5) TaxID=717982 RepID=J0D205_AURST|nr:hypothetical protein AURDEDRAFT_178269 [Auricularia subglabra TFB-10046 SS5]
MLHVALDDHPWTTQEIYCELWDSCFSDNFREELREKLMKAKQNGRPIKDYAKDLRNLAVRFPDIDEHALKRIFWDGSDAYIQLFWAEKGRSVEYDDIPTLLIYAQRAERRERLRRRLLETQEQSPASEEGTEADDQERSAQASGARPDEDQHNSETQGDWDNAEDPENDDYWEEDGAEPEQGSDREYSTEGDPEEEPDDEEYSEEYYSEEEPQDTETHLNRAPDADFASGAQEDWSEGEYYSEDY